MNSYAVVAREIMTQNLVTLSPKLEVFEAIDILLKKRISGAPVVCTVEGFMGIFSESSCMKVVMNAAYDGLPDASLMPFVDRDPPTIGPETDLLSICQTFLDQATRRLPVIQAGRLMGMVSRRDVMRKINTMARGKKCGHSELLYLSALLNEGRESVEVRIAK